MRQCHNKFYLLIQSALGLGRERKEDNEAAAALEDVFVRFTRLQSDNLEDEDDDVRFFQITIFFFLSFFEFHGTVIM